MPKCNCNVIDTHTCCQYINEKRCLTRGTSTRGQKLHRVPFNNKNWTNISFCMYSVYRSVQPLLIHDMIRMCSVDTKNSLFVKHYYYYNTYVVTE